MDAKDKRYSYDRFGMKGARVGQAVTDILATGDRPTLVGDIIDEYSKKYNDELEDCVLKNEHKFKRIFYVMVFQNKEMWAENVVRNWFVARATAPFALDMVQQYPHHNKILYQFDKENNTPKIIWNIPGLMDCVSIMKNPSMYDPQLCKWIEDCFQGLLKEPHLIT